MWWRSLRRRIRRALFLLMDLIALVLQLARDLEAERAAVNPEERSLLSLIVDRDIAGILHKARLVTGPADRSLQRGRLRKLAVDARQLKFTY